jgi:hypothetical protein
LIADVDVNEVIDMLGREKRTRDGQVDSLGWEEEIEDNMGSTKEGVEV